MKKIFALVVTIVVLSGLMTSVAMAEEKPLIGIGDYNENVIKVHQKLSELGIYSLRAEIPWSSNSEEAIKVLQVLLGLEESGVIENQAELERILTFEHEPFSQVDIASSRLIENLFVDPEFTSGATRNEDGYVFTTGVDGNVFNAVRWQLYSSKGEYIERIDSKGEGFHEGDYFFPYESGEYRIRLKANSNKHDESMTKALHLEQGQTYHFIYDVVSFEEHQVVIGGAAFGVKR